MKIEIPVIKFKEVIQKLERVSSKNPTLPVLSCILFEIKKNILNFKATNLDVGIEIPLVAKSDHETNIAVPASTVSSFISQLPNDGDVVSMTIGEGGNILFNTKNSKCTIKSIPSEDFPTIPQVTNGVKFVINPDTFIKGLKSVWYSASVSSIKPELSSVYVYKDTDNIVFVATDSFRLAEKKIKANKMNDWSDILIPFKNIPEIIRILEDFDGEVKVDVSKNLISFQSNQFYLVSRVIDGVFPDYKQIIPKGFQTEVVVLKQDLINALKISNVFADKFNQIRLLVDPKSKIFQISTKNSDIGENQTQIQSALSGDRIEVNFNHKYIIDCFQSIESDSLSLELSGTNRPMVIRPVSGNRDFTYIVMPMNR